MSRALVLWWIAVLIAAAGCSSARSPDAPADEAGQLGLRLQIGDLTIDSVHYAIANGTNSYSGDVPVGGAASLDTTIGGIAAGSGYRLTLSALGGSCAGQSGVFAVIADETVSVSVELVCTRPRTVGSVLINGATNECPNIISIAADPPVDCSVPLHVLASDPDHGPEPLHYSWSNGLVGSDPTFPCTSSGPTSVDITVSDGDPAPGCAQAFKLNLFCPECSGPSTPTVTIDASPLTPTVTVGHTQNILALIKLDDPSGVPVSIVPQLSITPNNGGIVLSSDAPIGGFLASGSTSFVLNLSIAAQQAGPYAIEITATSNANVIGAHPSLLVTPTGGNPVILPLGAYPDGIPTNVPTEVTFTARIVDFVAVPAELSVQQVGVSNGPAVILRDDGQNGDLAAGDGVYTGHGTVTAVAVGSLQFQATGSFPGVGTVGSEVLTEMATCFPNTLRPPDPTKIVTDPVSGEPILCNEVLASFAAAASCDQIAATVASLGGAVVGSIPGLGTYQIGLAGPCTGADARNAVSAFAANPLVTASDPSFADVRLAEVVPNDPEHVPTGPLSLMRADESWVIARGNVAIAVTDTGVDYNHEDLLGKVIKGRDFVNGDDDPMDDHGHGTSMASIAAANTNNGKGTAGVSWGSPILALKCMDAQNRGTIVNGAAAIKRAADAGATVINCSWATPTDAGVLRAAVAYATSRGALVVGSAGNDGANVLTYPCAYDAAFCVGATTASGDARASFSNFGSHVDIAAPGDNVAHALLGGGYGASSGTSEATALTSGAVAVSCSRFPSWRLDRIRQRIEHTAVPLNVAGLGAGRVDLFEAVFNGSFEDDLTGWDAVGTAGSVTSLGMLLPRQGRRMGLVSSGPDNAQVETTLQQSFTIQSGVTSIPIQFDYDFVTEEYPEFVGTMFNDDLRIVLVAPNGVETQLAAEQVNTSAFSPIAGIDFPGGDSTVGHTGWKTASVTVPVTQGAGRYQIRVRDVGDGIYDSDALVDHIRFK